MTTDQTPAVEVLARLLCAADVHVHDGDHPSWQQLRVAQHGRGQDDYRKAARWLLPRMTVATKPAVVPVPLSTQADRRAQLLDALDFAYCQGLGFDTPEALLVAYDASRAVPVPPPADQTALRDRIAAAIRDAACPGDCGNTEEECARERIQPFAWHYGRLAIVEGTPEQFADAVLAVLPKQTDRTAEAERPLSPDYEHPECGFHWHGRDGMDIPIRDGQPVCPRCELAKVEKKLAYVQRMRDEVGAECKRRGRIKLEQAERIVRLERELDGVRDQLGKEMLRADDAETELRRMAAEEQPAKPDRCPHGCDTSICPCLACEADEAQPAETPMFGTPDCTCIPFTRQGGKPRYCGPTDTVDMISGWEIGRDCPHHKPAVAEQPGKQTAACDAVSFRVRHNPHSWEPEPDADLVRCPGFSGTPE